MNTFRILRWQDYILRSPEDGGAGGGQGNGSQGNGEQGGAGTPQGGQGGGQEGAKTPDGGQAQPYYPDGLPDHLRGTSERETLDKLFGEHKGLRDRLAQQGSTPKEYSAYKFELSDQAKSVFAVDDNDKGLDLFKKVAHEAGFTDKHFSAVPKFLDAAIEAGLVPKPVNPAEVFEQLAPADFKGGPAERQAEGAKRVTQAVAHVDALVTNKKIPAEIGHELKLLAGSKAGVQALELFMNTVTQGAQTGGSATDGSITRESLQARMADPKGDRNAKEYDPAFAKETDRLYREFYK